MFRRLCATVHRRLQVTATLAHRRTAAASRPHFLGFVKPYSVASVGADDPSSLTAFSLTRSCGISDPAALDKALSVLTLLKGYGFDEAHLVRLVDRCPRVLSMDAEKTLKPKLEFYCAIGLVGTTLPKILSKCPWMLTCSVEKRLLPNAELLKSILKTNENLVNALKCEPWLITCDAGTTVLPKVDALRAYGVPDAVILAMFTRHGYALLTDAARFNEAFDKIKKMGICPEKISFGDALGVLAVTPKKMWQQKVENLSELGWSQNHILEAFAKCPYIARASIEKMRKAVKFVEENLAWTPEYTVKYPSVLSMNLEKRMMPRHAVLSILMHKGFIKTGFKGSHFLMSSENFRMEFVTKYQGKSPEIVEAYQRSEIG